MDPRTGLDYIVENAEYTTKLGAGEKRKIYRKFVSFDDKGRKEETSIIKIN